MTKTQEVVLFSSTAIALYGYDQGMMSLINTNEDYLHTMGIGAQDPLVGILVAVYYLGCSLGAVLFSRLSDQHGRKLAIFSCLAAASLGNLLMFVTGLGSAHAWQRTPRAALAVFGLGRVVMGLGVGGIDAVIPVYSSELSSDGTRGKALAQEFQMNIFGLNLAFGVNLLVTNLLGKASPWAWRIPIIVMQAFPVFLFAVIGRLPESPRWFIYHGRKDRATDALTDIWGRHDGQAKAEELFAQHAKEKGATVGYLEMITPGSSTFHPTVITVMGQVNQALTGYGAVSVYGPQIFELLGFTVQNAEYITQANYISYFFLMTLAWLLIDAVGRRKLLLAGSSVLTCCFLLLALFGGLAMHDLSPGPGPGIAAILGTISLFIATGAFGIGWLATIWLIPTELYATTARAQAAAISVVVWGLANFAVTLLSPLLFNNLTYWIFLVFAATNAVAGLWTYVYLPESGGRSFEDNQKFFEEAKEHGTWRVSRVAGGVYKRLAYGGTLEGENEPLLQRVQDQIHSG
ncbi:general substrate transporter [Coniella lustricola]|uniref:General substrate transporter n=1 Tax=Coniella lustricola TaxID=2025994 RepID=A0A2T2ZRW0_9PEZI|nr:general substrate transporter [Coniella lustricola]